MSRIPVSFRPIRNFILSIAKAIEDDSYLDMTETQFIGAVMKSSAGSVHPDKARKTYYEFMDDAGLPRLID